MLAFLGTVNIIVITIPSSAERKRRHRQVAGAPVCSSLPNVIIAGFGRKIDEVSCVPHPDNTITGTKAMVAAQYRTGGMLYRFINPRAARMTSAGTQITMYRG